MIRHAVTAISFVALLVLLGKQVGTLLDDPTIWPPDDFVEYWAAAKLTLDGKNPYDPEQLLPLQKAAGRDTDEAIMMWNPPWSLTAVLPLGLLPARLAQLLWLAGGLAASAFCGDQLWRLFGGSHPKRWIGWAVGMGFLPTAFALQSGQIALFLLLGVVLFLLFERRGWRFAAGAVTALVAIKPHLAYLLWLAILFDAFRCGCWRRVAGGVVAGVILTAIPLLLNPHVLSQYADAMGNRPPSGWMSPTIGTLLRMQFGEERFWLQFVPVAFGLAWFAYHWATKRRAWDWLEQTPLLVLVSFVTAPYGAWPFDMMLLLPAIMWVVVKTLPPQPPSLGGKGVGGVGLALWGLLAVNLACLGMNVAATGSFYFWWVSPAVLVLYAVGAAAGSGGGMKRVIAPGAVAFVAFWVLLLVAGRSSFFRDPGTFWHTTTGEKILHDGFIRSDPYTFTFAGQWWVPYQWLGEVGMALAHRVGGFDAQLLGAATILAAVFAWLTVRLLRTGLNLAVVAGLVALTLAAAGSHFHVRPHLVTIALLTLTMAWCVDIDAGRVKLSRLAWLVPIYIFWTNVHGGMLGGVASLGLVFAGWLVFWRLGLRSPVRSWKDVRFLVLVGIGCGLAALASPYGLDLVKTWRVILGEPALRQIIQEHRPLDVTEPYAWPVLGIAALFVFVMAGVPRSEWRASWLLPAFWLVQSFSRCRRAPLFAVVALVAITAMWPHTRWAAWLVKKRPDFYTPPTEEARSPWWANVWLPAVAVLLSLILQANRVPVPVIGSGWATHDSSHWPVELLDTLKEHEPKSPADPHRVFNEYLDGGFLIYHTPNYRVFVDDRCELFGGAWLLAFVDGYANDTAGKVEAWQREYGRFDFALTRTGSGYDDHFKSDPAWATVKTTPTATFYRRR